MANGAGKAAKRKVREIIQTEGLMIAYEAARDVCLDKTATAAARATAATSLLRSGGMFDRQDIDDEDKQDHEKPYHLLLTEAEQRLNDLKKMEAETVVAEIDDDALPDIFD